MKIFFLFFLASILTGCGSGLCPIGRTGQNCRSTSGGFTWVSPQGVLDTAFNGTGIFSTDTIAGADEGYGVTVQSDGKIVVASTIFPTASPNLNLMRFNTSGVLETAFGTAGISTSAAFSSNRTQAWPLQRSNGKILVVSSGSGASSYGLFQVNANGSVDTTFGTAGYASGAAFRCIYGELYPSDYLLARCTNGTDNLVIARFDTLGNLDTTFGTAGSTTSANVYGYSGSIKLKSDGTILMAGQTVAGGGNLIISKFDASGILDTTFGTAGSTTVALGTNAYPFGVAEQTDGKIVVGGTTQSGFYFTARFNSLGILDTTYGSSAGYTIHGALNSMDSANSSNRNLIIQPDNKIILAINRGGYTTLSIARIDSSGSFDTTFNSTGYNEWNPAAAINVQGYALHPDGRIVVVGGVLPAGARRTYLTLWK